MAIYLLDREGKAGAYLILVWSQEGRFLEKPPRTRVEIARILRQQDLRAHAIVTVGHAQYIAGSRAGVSRFPLSEGRALEHMRRIAYETVLRACGFGSLAIFCVMIGMSFEPRLAFQAGGTLTTLMAGILIYKARESLTKDYRKTEMWLYIEKDYRPPEAYAQWASSTILRDTYLTFALWTSAIAIAMWVIALLFSLAGF